MKSLTAILILFISCRPCQEVINYEFSEKRQGSDHWAFKKSLNLSLNKKNIFTMQIVASSVHLTKSFSDTTLINGTYKKSRRFYSFLDSNDLKVNFRLRYCKRTVLIKGNYYDKTKNSYVKLRNENIF